MLKSILDSILDFIQKNTTLVTIVLALIGYAAKYLNDLAIARRRDRLDRVNAQLPLLSASRTHRPSCS